MSKDKYPNIFSKSNGGYCVYYPSNNFATHAVLTIGEYARIFPSFSSGILGHLTPFRPIVCKQKYLMDYNSWYLHALGFCSQNCQHFHSPPSLHHCPCYNPTSLPSAALSHRESWQEPIIDQELTMTPGHLIKTVINVNLFVCGFSIKCRT